MKTYLAGGCYWGLEHYLQKLDGVIASHVGFMGGDSRYKTYEEVTSGITGHAEVVEVEYDPSKISLKDLWVYFFRLHDPTTLNRQKNDKGTQYRSAIFVNDDSEKRLAELLIESIDKSQHFCDKIVTSIEPVSEFFVASEAHQDYLDKNPGGYNCHTLGREINLI